jgi:hypothetical protein
MLSSFEEQIRKLAAISKLEKSTIYEDNRYQISDIPWMEGIFGFTDSLNYYADKKFIKNHIKSRIDYSENTGILKVIDGKYKAGWFIHPTLEEIINTASNIKNKQNKGRLKATVVVGKDVSDLHLECEPYSVIQLASQLNALEMIDPQTTPDHGIEIYSNDRTQGPIAAMACAPGLFVRNYNVIEKLGGQFNTLKNIGLKHKNGYLLWNDKPENILNKLSSDNITQIMIPCQIYTQVIGTTRVGDSLTNHFTRKLVHQIYTSAAPINKYGNCGNIKHQIKINEYILFAQYMGEILMAYILNSIDKPFTRASTDLTLVGAGAFGLSIDTVLDIIKAVCVILADIDIDIYIHGYTEYVAKNIENSLGIDRHKLTVLGRNVSTVDFYDEIFKKFTHKLNNIFVETREFGVFPLYPKHYPLISLDDFYEAANKNIDLSNYLVIYPNNKDIKVYKLRQHQENILKLMLTHKSCYYTIETEDLLVDVDADNFSFRSDTGVIGYFVDMEQHPNLLSEYDMFSNGECTIYDLSSVKVTKWPL